MDHAGLQESIKLSKTAGTPVSRSTLVLSEQGLILNNGAKVGGLNGDDGALWRYEKRFYCQLSLSNSIVG